MNYLFLDLSTSSTGWVVSDDQHGNNKYGYIPASASNVFKRIIVMREAIKQLVKENNIDKIVAEEVHLDDFKNTHTYKILTWLQGIILLAAYEENPKIDYEFILPNSWRSKIGIKTGRGVKRETLKAKDMEYVKNKYGISANDDVCDAICIKDAYFTPDRSEMCAF